MRTKRIENWWEPVYDKETPAFDLGVWNGDRCHENRTFKRFNGGSIQKKIKNVTFKNCDFEDDFDEKRYVFEDCKFIKCDFGGSKWKKSKFRSCEFRLTSFSLSTFHDCEFRDCTFVKIAFSGNATDITDTIVTNPMAFISAAEVFVAHLPDHISAKYQRAHLKITQSNLSRILMYNLSREGSESSYYDAVKCRTLMSARARYAQGLIDVYGKRRKIKLKDLTLSDIWRFLGIYIDRGGALTEEMVLTLFGLMNAWGASISRALVSGFVFVAIFAIANYLKGDDDVFAAVSKTFEIFLLFGYTNYTSNLQISIQDRAVYILNASAGLVWYTIFITTVINKLTRQRG